MSRTNGFRCVRDGDRDTFDRIQGREGRYRGGDPNILLKTLVENFLRSNGSLYNIRVGYEGLFKVTGNVIDRNFNLCLGKFSYTTLFIYNSVVP